MHPTLVIVGLSFRTSPLDVRERFWLTESQRSDALRQLSHLEGIDEALVLVTCSRTEFVLWSSDFSAAANSVLSFLTHKHGLRLCEWKHFYRMLGEEAVLHLFRVAASLDAMVPGERYMGDFMQKAREIAQQAGTIGPFLGSIVDKALLAAGRVRQETALFTANASVACTAAKLAEEIAGPLVKRQILLLGAGRMSGILAESLAREGVGRICIANRSQDRSLALAAKVGGQAISFDERLPALADSDVIISSTASQHPLVTREQAEAVTRQRRGRSIFFIDLALPRNIDPGVRELPRLFLYDMDDLAKAAARHREGDGVVARAESLVAAEVAAFRRTLIADRVVPTLVALRKRLDDIGRQEMDRYASEFGPFSESEREAFRVLGNRIVHRIAGSLVHEIEELPQTFEQEKLTNAVRRLFQLEHCPRGNGGPPH